MYRAPGRWIAAVFVLVTCITVHSARAQYTNKSSVLDGSGAQTSGGSYTNISAAGQPGGIAVSAGGSYVNHAGFLNTFILKPALDTDGDGLADELDQDNDNDGLADATEIGGDAFSPVTSTHVNDADTDGDGMSDGEESVAGTDPGDANAFLEITSITTPGGNRLVEWVGRSNKTYRLLRSDDALKVPTNVIAFVAANGAASPPWYVQPVSIFDAFDPTNNGYYAVDVAP